LKLQRKRKKKGRQNLEKETFIASFMRIVKVKTDHSWAEIKVLCERFHWRLEEFTDIERGAGRGKKHGQGPKTVTRSFQTRGGRVRETTQQATVSVPNREKHVESGRNPRPYVLINVRQKTQGHCSLRKAQESHRSSRDKRCGRVITHRRAFSRLKHLYFERAREGR